MKGSALPGTDRGGEFSPDASPFTPHGVADRQVERLRWRSRRGLLELDLLFSRFWEKNISSLDERDASALDRLLQLADNDLLDMVMDRQPCSDAGMLPMLRRLQQA